MYDKVGHTSGSIVVFCFFCSLQMMIQLIAMAAKYPNCDVNMHRLHNIVTDRIVSDTAREAMKRVNNKTIDKYTTMRIKCTRKGVAANCLQSWCPVVPML